MTNRLRSIRKELSLTQEELARILGVGKSALSMIETGKASLSERNKNILIQELNVNPDWLDRGIGAIFNAPPNVMKYLRRSDSTMPMQSIPLYNMDGSAGLVSLFVGSSVIKPIDYIHIPNMPKCDGALYVVGESMYPLVKSGDIILYKQIKDIEDIFWGDMYLISFDLEGEEFVTVKYLHRSQREGYLKLVSENRQYADKEIEISRVRALAYVKASVRMNTMR